jgi:PAS domain S-box-containing protein
MKSSITHEEIEKNVRQLNEYKHFFNSNSDLCGIANQQGYFETINTNFTNTLGYTEEEFCQIPFIELIHPEDVPATLLEYEKLKAGAVVINFINRYRKKNGDYLYLDWNATPNSTSQKLYCVARDITERRKAEEQLLSVNKELEAFSYSVSHDLRAPLRAINGFAKILKEDYASTLDEEGTNFLNMIQENSKKMGALIDDLLEFSRLGRINIATSEINMNKLVKEVISEQVQQEKIEYIIHDLLPANGTPVLIKQLWQNLISNAIKYSKHQTKIKIEIGSSKRDNLAIYYIKDNGVGFDMRYYNKLFGVFQRLHSYEEFEGTGIGLAIVQRIVHHHKGTVWAESKLNEGSVFYFSLPAGQEQFINI